MVHFDLYPFGCAGFITAPLRKQFTSGAVLVEFRIGVAKQASLLDGEEEAGEYEAAKELDWYSLTPCYRHNRQ